MPSQAFINAAFNPSTDEVLLAWLRVYHDELPEPLYFVRDARDWSRDGNTYTGVMFDLTLPSSNPGQMPVAAISVPNVDREILAGLRQLIPYDRPTCEVELSLASSPTVIEMGPHKFELKSVEWDLGEVSIKMGGLKHGRRRFPKDLQTNSNFPGAFPG